MILLYCYIRYSKSCNKSFDALAICRLSLSSARPIQAPYMEAPIMSQINLTREQRKKAYEDLIASCHERENLPRLLDKAMRLYGRLNQEDLIELLGK